MANPLLTRQMVNSTNIGLVTLLFLAIGCSCPSKLREIADRDSPPPPKPVTTSPTPESPLRSSSKGDYEVDFEKFERVKIGMKRAEVENILGGKGTAYYNGKGGGVSFVSVKWEGEKFKTIFVSFRNEKVTSKSQVGLK